MKIDEEKEKILKEIRNKHLKEYIDKELNKMLRIIYNDFFVPYYLSKKKQLSLLSKEEIDKRIDLFFKKAYYLYRKENLWFYEDKTLKRIILEGKEMIVKLKKNPDFYKNIVDDSAKYYFFYRFYNHIVNLYKLEVEDIKIDSGKFSIYETFFSLSDCQPIILDDIEYEFVYCAGRVYDILFPTVIFAKKEDNHSIIMFHSTQEYYKFSYEKRFYPKHEIIWEIVLDENCIELKLETKYKEKIRRKNKDPNNPEANIKTLIEINLEKTLFYNPDTKEYEIITSKLGIKNDASEKILDTHLEYIKEYTKI